MSIYSDWVARNPSVSDKTAVNAEWVLKILDNTIGNVDTSIYSPITYTELRLLINQDKLKEGQKYLITDFKTIYRQPATNLTLEGSEEPLVVTALSTNKLEPIAFSPSNPYDVIYYDVTRNNTGRYEWAVSTDRGQIYRRITENNNDIPYDVRAIKFRRWALNVTTTYSSSSTYTVGTPVVYDGNIYIAKQEVPIDNTPASDSLYWHLVAPSSEDNSYVSTSSSSFTIYIKGTSYTIPVASSTYKDFYTFDSGSGSVIDSANVRENVISSCKLLYDVVLTNSVFIGDNFYNNTIGNYFYNNTIENRFAYNTIGNNFQNNIIGNYFNFNIIGNSFQNNTTGNNFYNNIIGNSFYYNTIGNSFDVNTIGNNFFNNTIGNNFNNNTIEDYFYYNTIGNNFYHNTIGNSFYYNTIGNYFYHNRFGDYFRYNVMTAFTSATSETTAVRKNIFENGIGKNSSSYARIWPTSEDSRLRSDYTVTYEAASDWTINSATGTVVFHYTQKNSPFVMWNQVVW
jgi:hypothetical protein